jgi:hypothetical protein
MIASFIVWDCQSKAAVKKRKEENAPVEKNFFGQTRRLVIPLTSPLTVTSTNQPGDSEDGAEPDSTADS